MLLDAVEPGWGGTVICTGTIRTAGVAAADGAVVVAGAAVAIQQEKKNEGLIKISVQPYIYLISPRLAACLMMLVD